MIGLALASIFFNTLLTSHLPKIQSFALILHILGFFAMMIPLWTIGPRNSARTVFTQFSDFAGWGNVAYSTLIGMHSATWVLTGNVVLTSSPTVPLLRLLRRQDA